MEMFAESILYVLGFDVSGMLLHLVVSTPARLRKVLGSGSLFLTLLAGPAVDATSPGVWVTTCFIFTEVAVRHQYVHILENQTFEYSDILKSFCAGVSRPGLSSLPNSNIFKFVWDEQLREQSLVQNYWFWWCDPQF